MEWNTIVFIYSVPIICSEPISHASTHFISYYTSCYHLFHFTGTEFEGQAGGGSLKHPMLCFLFFLFLFFFNERDVRSWSLTELPSCWGGWCSLSSAWQIWKGMRQENKVLKTDIQHNIGYYILCIMLVLTRQ